MSMRYSGCNLLASETFLKMATGGLRHVNTGRLLVVMEGRLLDLILLLVVYLLLEY